MRSLGRRTCYAQSPNISGKINHCARVKRQVEKSKVINCEETKLLISGKRNSLPKMKNQLPIHRSCRAGDVSYTLSFIKWLHTSTLVGISWSRTTALASRAVSVMKVVLF